MYSKPENDIDHVFLYVFFVSKTVSVIGSMKDPFVTHSIHAVIFLEITVIIKTEFHICYPIKL